MDNMLMKMEKYTGNLEAVVEDRTRQLMEEKAKIDHLLYNMMPASVVQLHLFWLFTFTHKKIKINIVN